MTPEHAEAIALQAFAFLAREDDLLMRFANLSGILPNDMRQAASEPGFLTGILDFFLSHEPDLLALAEAETIAPEQIATARMVLNPADMSGFE